MCFFKKPKPPEPLPQPPPISGRIDTQDDVKPPSRDIIDEDDKESGKNVELGTSNQNTAVTGNRSGTDSLRISLNTGTTTTSSSGNTNVPG